MRRYARHQRELPVKKDSSLFYLDRLGNKKSLALLPYWEYLKTKYWTRLRREIIKQRKVCEDCGKKGKFNLHHLQYVKRGTEHNSPDSLKWLCKICHMETHDIDISIYEPWGGRVGMQDLRP
jgi:hypothetical protein